MFHIIDERFFVPLASPNKLVYWECICKLFSVMDHQLSFGVEREVLADELEFYFNQENAAQLVEEEFQAYDSRSLWDGSVLYIREAGRGPVTPSDRKS